MNIEVSATPLHLQKEAAFIFFFAEKEPLLSPSAQSFRRELLQRVEISSFKGQAGQTALFQMADQIFIVTGIGKKKNFHRGLLEQAAAAAIRTGCAAGLDSFALDAASPLESVSDSDYQLLAGRGACWGSYRFSAFKSDAEISEPPSLTFFGEQADASILRFAQIQGDALRKTADLANLPGNRATPKKIAHYAKELAQEFGLKYEVFGASDLAEKGCEAFLSVAQGSGQDPEMVLLRKEGTQPDLPPLVLIGKTVTFDAGGVSLKPGRNMGWMRYDKCGGMAVLATMQMVAQLQPARSVVGILAIAENMPDAHATRPGDIVRARNGKTIEILNTDAEGRLLLADALALASEMKPKAIVDIATLTGACITALGSAASAVLGNDESLIGQLIAAGTIAGERLWPLPLYTEYADDMKSDFADLSNLCKSGKAGTATAAAFLREFVPEEIPWAHLDIAGTAWFETQKPHQAPGATLFGARLLLQWIIASQSAD